MEFETRSQKAAGFNVSAVQKASGLDRLIIWLDQRPWPAWLTYTGLIVAGEILFNLTFWIDGSVSFGERVTLQSVSIPLVILSFAFYHYLTKAGSKALQDFRPILEADEEEITQIERALNYLPSHLGWIVLFLSATGSILYVFGSANTFGDIVPKSFLPATVIYITSVIVVIPFYNLLFRMVRQVRILGVLYQRASNINLLHLAPAHAFARLTASTGSGLILLMIVGNIYNPDMRTGVNLLGLLAALLIGVVIFIVPLIGMRNRLVHEKSRRMEEISELLQASMDQIHSRVRNQTDVDISEARSIMGALIEERALIEKVSTWPWNSGTIRGFASSMILPVVLWLITRFLGRYF
ncbi:MAG: hypothetical protein PVH60_10730 [Anaerolineales bacterium]|jgi:hypothetical protein